MGLHALNVHPSKIDPESEPTVPEMLESGMCEAYLARIVSFVDNHYEDRHPLYGYQRAHEIATYLEQVATSITEDATGEEAMHWRLLSYDLFALSERLDSFAPRYEVKRQVGEIRNRLRLLNTIESAGWVDHVG